MKDIFFSHEPSAEKVIVYLIREELKSRKFFEGLRELGLDDNFYQTDLMELIMAGLGLLPDEAEQYNFCYQLISEHSSRVVEDADELLDEAKQVYGILLRHAGQCATSCRAPGVARG
jgi:hypothetical protein